MLLSSHDQGLLYIPLHLRQITPKAQRWPDGQQYITAVHTENGMDGVDKPKLLILVRQPLTIALQEFTRLQDQLVLSAILAFCALSLIAILLARKIAAHCERYAGRWKPPVANCHEAAATPKPSC